jgi:hypothetical protein
VIGFFGDSFIDVSSREKSSWPTLVSDSLNESGDFYGRSGTSHWYSYELFLKNYKKYDTVVFCHTSHSRWPHLPEEETGHHWQIGYSGHGASHNNFMNNINKIYHDIFSDKLLTFLCSSIFKSINEICRENNIHLINIIPFGTPVDPYDTTTDFVNIFNIDKISWKEETHLDNKSYLVCQWLSDQNKKKVTYDPRYCHLNGRNNIIFSKIVADLISNRVKDQSIDALKYQWEFHDPDLDLELGKQK